jgi:formylglycine-generating enzyme required for sulfatase activity
MGAQATDPDAPGYDPEAQPNEAPVREVPVASFWIQQREQDHVAVEACRASGRCEGLPEGRSQGVSWTEARETCKGLGARLPTENEWEYAARGTDGRKYPWGNQAPCGLPVAEGMRDFNHGSWHMIPGCQDQEKVWSPRGLSPWHIEDLGWRGVEWVEDIFPGEGLRVQRGGSSAAESPAELRAAARWGAPAAIELPDVGFRCAW